MILKGEYLNTRDKWATKISNELTKAHAIYPGATLRVEASEPLMDLLQELFVNQDKFAVKIENPKVFRIFGVELIEVDDVSTFRIVASFRSDG